MKWLRVELVDIAENMVNKTVGANIWEEVHIADLRCLLCCAVQQHGGEIPARRVLRGARRPLSLRSSRVDGKEVTTARDLLEQST